MEKLKYLFIITFLLIGFQVNAQGKHAKIKALKTAYITDELDLTQEEAEKFWPIYNSYHKKKHQLRYVKARKLRKEIYELQGTQNTTDKKAAELLEQFLEIETALFNNTQSLYKKLKGVLPPQKLVKLHLTEHEFSRKLIKKLRHKTPH